MANRTIHFFDSHIHTLDLGEYTVTLSQNITDAGGSKSHIAGLDEQSFSFQLDDEHNRVDDHQVLHVYPPQGSSGDYQFTLPHLIFRNSLFPWESNLKGAEIPTVPGVALILVDESESHLITSQNQKRGEEQTTILTVPKAFFNAHFGLSASDKDSLSKLAKTISNLAHVRQVVTGDDVQEFACLLANKLPKPGHFSTVHLVSLGDLELGDNNQETLELTSLFNFSFKTVEPADDGIAALSSLNAAVMHSNFNGNKENKKGEALQNQAFVPLQHFFDNGQDEGFSFYRGPFVPEKQRIEIPIARRSSALLRKHADHGLVDVSYAAAWELGRLTALASTTIRTTLMNWQGSAQRIQKQHLIREQVNHTNLIQLIAPAHTTENLKATENEGVQITTLLRSWMLLIDLPFQYLIPDPRLIPDNSIRFFQIDEAWVKALLTGAFSVTALALPDHDEYENNANSFWELIKSNWPNGAPYGFMLNSAVVAHHPEFVITGKKGEELVEILITKKEGNLTYVLFNEKPNFVEIATPSQTLHAAFNPNEDHSALTLHNANLSQPISVPFNQDSRVVDVTALLEKISDLDPTKPIGPAHLPFYAMRAGQGVLFKL